MPREDVEGGGAGSRESVRVLAWRRCRDEEEGLVDGAWTEEGPLERVLRERGGVPSLDERSEEDFAGMGDGDADAETVLMMDEL